MDDYSLTPNGFKSASASDYDDQIAFGGFVALPSLGEHTRSHALDWSSATHPGLVRLHNEDHHRIASDLGLFVLADGMGGYNAGEVASEIATATIVDHVSRAQSTARSQRTEPTSSRQAAFACLEQMRVGVLRANEAIISTAALRPECLGMGTTVLCAAYRDGWLAVAHVGDSRLYRWRDRRLECLTKDHSVGQEMIDAGLVSGEQARTIAARGILTRAVGAEAYVEVEASVHAAKPNDVYLMCSDGLTDMVDNGAIGRILSANIADGPEQVCQMLISESLARGGSDNVTVITLQIAG
jgi:PPM family protein phosphatase